MKELIVLSWKSMAYFRICCLGLLELPTLGENAFCFELPRLFQRDRFSWMRDEEFSRETLAGMNPFSIKCLTALKEKRLFLIDYYDVFMLYVKKVREIKGTTLYASRTLFILDDDQSLRPMAIELTRPPMDGKPQWKQVYTPETSATRYWVWMLARLMHLPMTLATTNLSVTALLTCNHQVLPLIMLRTHCCTEPYIIATHRQLSSMHPIYRLLHPYFRYTIEINAHARQNLINAGGIIERTFSPQKYSMEMSSVIYGLSGDLIIKMII
ncbi:Linoleate 13S-lipoxygenase 2-1 chloroplastic [Bienertia sinuspersici]